MGGEKRNRLGGVQQLDRRHSRARRLKAYRLISRSGGGLVVGAHVWLHETKREDKISRYKMRENVTNMSILKLCPILLNDGIKLENLLKSPNPLVWKKKVSTNILDSCVPANTRVRDGNKTRIEMDGKDAMMFSNNYLERMDR